MEELLVDIIRKHPNLVKDVRAVNKVKEAPFYQKLSTAEQATFEMDLRDMVVRNYQGLHYTTYNLISHKDKTDVYFRNHYDLIEKTETRKNNLIKYKDENLGDC